MSERTRRVLWLIVVIGTLLRVAGWNRGWSADEVAWLGPHALDPLHDPESGINPPLLRFVLVGAFGVAWAPTAGRALSLACGIASLPVAFALGRRVGGETAGLLVAAAVALQPDAIEHATLFRAYSPWLLTALVHVWGLATALDGGRRGRLAVAVTAALLPWLHYTSIALLLVEAATLAMLVADGRRLVGLFAPSLVAVVGLVPFLHADAPFTPPASGLPLRVALNVLSAGYLGVFVLLPLGWLHVLFAWRRASPVERILAVGTLTVTATLTVLAFRVDVRPPTSVFALPYAVPLGAVALVRLHASSTARTRVVGAVVAALVLASTARFLLRVEGRDGVRSLWRDRESVPALQAAQPVFVLPAYELTSLVYEAQRQPISAVDATCGPGVPEAWRQAAPLGCVTLDGTPFVGVDRLPPGTSDAVVFADDGWTLPSACRPVTSGRGYVVGECGQGAP